MGVQITTAFVQQYSTNVGMLLQQQGSRFRAHVREQACFGQAATYVEQFGKVNGVKNLARNSDTPIVGTPQDRRWVYPSDYDWADLVDQEDKLRLLIDPTAPITLAGVYALGRNIDDEIINGIFGNCYDGQNGTNNLGHLCAYNSGSQVVSLATGSTAATGLNVAKLRAAKLLLMQSELDMDTDELWIGITAKQHDNLLNEIQVVNKDYNGEQPVLEDGMVKRFMGFNFLHTERIPGGLSYNGTLVPSTEVAGAAYLVPCWAKSGVGLGLWNDIKASVDKRPDKRNTWQVYCTGTFGATRIEELRTVAIPCV